MRIEQVLHGYSEGHRLLASSTTELSLSDRRKMSLLSDWNEYVSAQDDDSSYLTCYSLPDSPYYVVAKTWYADEKERPGCVWTHSLLIDLRAFTGFFDYLLLFSYFKQPKGGDYSLYEESIEISDDDRRERIAGDYEDIPSLDYWLWQMLENKQALMLTYQGYSSKSQQFLLSLMNHIPKAMLSGMSMCSGTGRLLKYEGETFNFQLTSEARRSIPKLSGRVVEGEKVEGWYETIANSILKDGVDIPMLIARFSDEIEDRTEALGAVVLVFTLLERLKNPGAENEQKFQLSLRIMATAFPQPEQGKQFKSVVLSENVTKFFFGEERFIYQMVITPYWCAFDYEACQYNVRVRRYVSEKEVGEYAPLMSDILKSQTDNPAKKNTLLQTVREYGEDEIEMLFSYYWDYYFFLCQNDSRMLDNTVWLKAEGEKFSKLYQLFVNKNLSEFDHWEILLSKLLSENISVDYSIIEKIGSHYTAIIKEILNWMNKGCQLREEWVKYCKTHRMEIMAWMKEQTSLNKELVKFIIEAFNPSSGIVKSSDTIVWRCMLNAKIEQGMLLKYSTFLFVLSYNLTRNDDAFALYRKSFLPVYDATAEDRIDAYWPEIGPLCPRPFLGWEWDRCDMLRKGFVERVLNEHRGASVARKFTANRNLNKKLYKLVSKKYHDR